MRKVIVSNLVTLDGYYEGKGRSLGALFEHFHEDYAGDEVLDYYNLERLRAADTLLFSGRDAFIGFRDFWWDRENAIDTSPVRREIARVMNPMEKVVISDKIHEDELAPWNRTHVIRLADAHQQITVMRQQDGKDMLIFGGRTLMNDLLEQGLVDELHLMIFPLIANEGTPLFDRPQKVSLKLLGTQTWQGSGIIIAIYGISPPKVIPISNR